MPDITTNNKINNLVLVSDEDFVIAFTYRYDIDNTRVYRDWDGTFWWAFDTPYADLVRRSLDAYHKGDFLINANGYDEHYRQAATEWSECLSDFAHIDDTDESY